MDFYQKNHSSKFPKPNIPLFQHSIIPEAESQSMLQKPMYFQLVVEIPRRQIKGFTS